MTNETPETIGRKMDALGLWDALLPYNWIVKPRGTAFPYFCTLMAGDSAFVKVRFLMVEGWQTFHDYVRTHVDRFWGFYSVPMEVPHFELVVAASGEVRVFRHDPGYMPRELRESERPLLTKMLWEAYGVMMRVESDRELPLRFAGEKSMFARVETPDGWVDRPLEIPDPRPHVEKVSFPKALLAKAKDLPFAKDERVELDFRILPGIMTQEPRPRCAYELIAIDAETGKRIIASRTSVTPDGGLRAMWEDLPPRILKSLVELGRVPGEIRVPSGRVFRLLRPLCMDLPIKLSFHDSLPRLDAAFANP